MHFGLPSSVGDCHAGITMCLLGVVFFRELKFEQRTEMEFPETCPCPNSSSHETTSIFSIQNCVFLRPV